MDFFSLSDYIDLDRMRHGNSQNDTLHNDTQLTIGMSQAAFMALGKMTFSIIIRMSQAVLMKLGIMAFSITINFVRQH
jgi:hypothetical protein